MKVTGTPFSGLLVLEPKILEDSRGHFFESFHQDTYRKLGLPNNFVQENQSRSWKNVVRGLHFQKPPKAQTKLVRVLFGTILDVVVDLRRSQPTYGRSYCLELSAENQKRILVPPGFAHGFSVLSDYADVVYWCDEFYSPENESGLRLDDASLGIDWQVDSKDRIISAKDLKLPPFSEAFSFE